MLVNKYPELRELYLRRCKSITELGLRPICNLCNQLHLLDISVDDNALKAVAANCGNLRQLLLLNKCIQITDEGFKFVAQCCRSTESARNERPTASSRTIGVNTTSEIGIGCHTRTTSVLRSLWTNGCEPDVRIQKQLEAPQREAAASTFQRLVRGRADRRIREQLWQILMEEKAKNEAASKRQAMFRGHHGRKAVAQDSQKQY